VVGGKQLGDGGAVVVAEEMGGVEVQRVKQAEHDCCLGGQGPVGVRWGLGVAQAEQVGGDAPVVRGEQGGGLAPDETGEGQPCSSSSGGPSPWSM
jgi:hypothetical protein